MPAPQLSSRASSPRVAHRRRLLSIVVVALAAAITLTGATAFAATAAASTTRITACDGVSVRTGPRTTAHRAASLPAGARLVTVAAVRGGSWHTTCNGDRSGSKWYKVVKVNGKRVSSLYGVSSVYVATGVVVLQKAPRTVACDGTKLWTRPTTHSTSMAKLPAGTVVGVNQAVSGRFWSTSCTGSRTSGTLWYKISYIGSQSVKKLYGVGFLYAAKGLFTSGTVTVSDTTPKTVACDGTKLWTKPTTRSTSKDRLSAGDTVSVTRTVSGTAWSTSCTGSTTSGSQWYEIAAIGQQSVWKLYGVSVVYAAQGLFATGTLTDTSSYIEGIDVSHWQGTINWSKVAAAGKQFAFIKASDGHILSDGTMFVDDMYATNRAQAEANGIKVGAYHFADPDATPGDAVAEADHFIATADWKPGELLPVLDLETTGGLSVTDLQAWVQAFLDRIFQQTGVKAIIYVSPSFWEKQMGNTKQFAVNGYKVLWIAHWGVNSPRVPAGNWNNNSWTFWQYTSSGSVSGISGRVDLDRYRRSNFNPVTLK
jgi:GH25 family lysozyme M1 (1,4-beta-N-acetylmuramidase)